MFFLARLANATTEAAFLRYLLHHSRLAAVARVKPSLQTVYETVERRFGRVAKAHRSLTLAG